MRFHVAPESRGTSLASIVGLTAWRSLIVAFIFIAAALVSLERDSPSLVSSAFAANATLSSWSGARPEAFVLQDIQGGEQTLASRRGTVTLVHFFATWCEPCREELPALRRLSERGGAALNVVAISVAEVDPRVRRFLQTMPLNFPVLMDRDRAVARNWNVTTLPTTVVLDQDLRPRLIVETDFAWDTIEPAQLLKQVASAPTPQTVTDNSKANREAQP